VLSQAHGADVDEVMIALGMAHAMLVGHRMGCRVPVEVALQVPDRTVGAVLIDGSKFATAMEPVPRDTFAMRSTATVAPDGSAGQSSSTLPASLAEWSRSASAGRWRS
jgi:pimeloyl-ACP methyl ester carboxylesterase